LIAAAAARDLTPLIGQKIWFGASFASFHDRRQVALAAIDGQDYG